MSKMFNGCTSLINLDLHDLSISSAYVGNMFDGCTSLKTIDLSGVTTAVNAYNMFANIPNLVTIYVSNSWDFSNQPANMPIFSGSTSLIGGNGTTYDSSKIDKIMAVIDTPSNPGYLTLKTN